MNNQNAHQIRELQKRMARGNGNAQRIQERINFLGGGQQGGGQTGPVQQQPWNPQGGQAGGPGGMENRFLQPFQPPQGWAQPNFANDKGFTMERGMGGGLPTQYGPMNGAYGQPLGREFGQQQPQFMNQGGIQDAMGRFPPMEQASPGSRFPVELAEKFKEFNQTQSLQAPGAVELEPGRQRVTAPNNNYQNSFGSQQPQAQPSAGGQLTAPNNNYQNAFGPRPQGPGAMGRLTAPNNNYRNSQGARKPRQAVGILSRPPNAQ